MNIQYQNALLPKSQGKAISVCLYSSPRLNFAKHVAPLVEYMGDPDPEYDLLIFHDGSVELPQNLKARLFLVETNEEGFQKHLWRYLGALEQYNKVWFRGTDTPRVPAREKRLEQSMDMWRLDLLMWSSEAYRCTGRIALSANGCRKLADRLASEEAPRSHWHCDEEFLSEWVTAEPIKTLLALDRPHAKGTNIAAFIEDLMDRGNHTIVIKDRNDSLPPTK